MMPNGTLSLTIALIACGIGSGDEVIVPDYTMAASANSVKLAGAEVVFADIHPENLCLDFECMQRTVSIRTKAIMLVTINGRYPENLEVFVDFCRKRSLWLIEDAAQSLGSFKDGKHLGTFGHIGSYSFSAPKVISTGQGGALVTNDETIIKRIRKLRDFGRESSGGDHYLTMGWNLKFTDIQAVIGLEQMKKLIWRVKRKKEIYKMYCRYLEDLPGISVIPTNLEDTSPWFIDILVEAGRRDEMIEHLRRSRIGSRPFYPALHAQPVYNRSGSYPITESVARRGLWLPSSSNLSNEQIEYICEQVRLIGQKPW
jgi:perosamine synthetase